MIIPLHGGSVIDFYRDLYAIDTGTAIKELEEMAGLRDSAGSVRRSPVKPSVKPLIKVRDFKECLTQAELEFYEERLSINPAGALKELKLKRYKSNVEVFQEFEYYCIKCGWDKRAYNYLVESRKIPPIEVERFRLFYVKDYNKVNNHLKKQFPLEQLQKSGLYNTKEDGSGNLIFYKHRIIIPYLVNNELSYLRGRFFDETGPHTDGGKYIGLADDELGINTSRRIFNMDTMKRLIPGERFYITEGEFDAITVEGLGKFAVAIPGIGNIPEKRFFKKMCDYQPVLCMDNDNPGGDLRKALIEMFNNFRKVVMIKKIPESYKDVSDFVIDS